jgi:penicillin-binding protein 2
MSYHYHANINRRLRMLALIMMAGMSAIGLRLWHIQIVDGELYSARMAKRGEVRVRIPPVRGEIRDRNGVVLASNRASYQVSFYLPDVVRSFRELNDGNVPKVHYRGRVHGMLKDLYEPDIVRIVNSTVMPRLVELDLAEDYNSKQLARHFRVDSEVPYTYREDLDFPTIAKFSEHNVGVSGVRIRVAPVRVYPYGALAAHLLGYVGQPEEIGEEPDIGDFDFYEANAVGKANVEYFMDKYLRGIAGVRVMRRDLKGVIDKELREEPPTPGANVELTIDARIQYIAEKALRAVGRGAAVVVAPDSGEILAMASVPSFDSNVFIPSIAADDWEKLTSAEADPLVNRAISTFPSGSTFKLITALAGLRMGLADKSFHCYGGVSYGNHYFKCWIAGKGTHGVLRVSDAIKVSCNAFFYQYGNAAGIESIDAVGKLLGLGQATGVPLTGEQEGILPGPEWMRLNHPRERWTSAYTANVSIGQGYVLVSPLQLAMCYAAVANGGTVYSPRLIRRVLDRKGKLLLNESGAPVLADKRIVRGRLQDIGVRTEDIELLRHALWRVVNEDGGTARRARLPGHIVAGKTGTAQNKRNGVDDTIAWFVGFAPVDKPRYVVCVMVEGGKGGGAVAAPIVAKILGDTLELDKTTSEPLQLARLEPPQSSDPFRFINSVSFGEGTSSVAAFGDSSSQNVRSGAGRGRSMAAPRIRPRPDALGRIKVRRAEPARARPVRRGGFFERLFRRR